MLKVWVYDTPGKWVYSVTTEEFAADWADHHPHLIYFFAELTCVEQ